MKTVIFTYEGAPEERVKNTQKLKEQLNADVFTGSTDTIKNLVDLCRRYNDSLLILEDDVELCEGFKDFTDSILEKYVGNVVNFHFNTFPRGDLKESLTINDKQFKLYEVPGSKYIWNQCFFLPNNARKLIVDNEKGFRRSYPYYVRTKQQDVYIAYCIRDSEFIAVYPSLVRHLDFGSTIRDSKSSKTLFTID